MSKSFGKLFGGSRPVQQLTRFQTLPGFAQEAFREAVTGAQDLAGQPELFAPTALTPDQLSAIELLRGGAAPLTAESFGEQLSVFQDPFEEQVVQNTLEDISRTGRGFLSDIGAGATAAGGFGGSRQGVLEAQLGGELAREAGRAAGGLRSRGFQQATSNVLRELGRQRTGALDLLGAGDIIQGQQTAERQAPLEALRFLASMAQGVPGGGGALSFREQPGLLQRFESGAGGLSSLGGLAGGLGTFFSDRRLKENIEKVGEKDGVNIYEFDYINGEGRYRGVMADEVDPEAVKVYEGYLAVNYDMLNIPFERIE